MPLPVLLLEVVSYPCPVFDTSYPYCPPVYITLPNCFPECACPHQSLRLKTSMTLFTTPTGVGAVAADVEVAEEGAVALLIVSFGTFFFSLFFLLLHHTYVLTDIMADKARAGIVRIATFRAFTHTRNLARHLRATIFPVHSTRPCGGTATAVPSTAAETRELQTISSMGAVVRLNTVLRISNRDRDRPHPDSHILLRDKGISRPTVLKACRDKHTSKGGNKEVRVVHLDRLVRKDITPSHPVLVDAELVVADIKEEMAGSILTVVIKRDFIIKFRTFFKHCWIDVNVGRCYILRR